MITHRNLTANIKGVSQYISCGPSARLLSILPLSHMYEQMGGLFLVLYSGASVTYPTSRQPTVLARTMRERKVTIMLLVPQGLELLMNGIEREVKRQGKEALWNKLLLVAGRTPFGLRRHLLRRVHKQFGGKLDFIVSGGAALDPDLGRKWELLGVKIVQGYGTTEASPVISNHSIWERRLDSNGRPLPNVEVKISDAGEVLARGDSITPGYWNAPEETAESFDGDWYKTGDLGYFDEDGFLHIQGPDQRHDRAAQRPECLPGGHPSGADQASECYRCNRGGPGKGFIGRSPCGIDPGRRKHGPGSRRLDQRAVG